MKVWSVSEIDNVVSLLAPLVGSRLQEIRTSDSDVVLGFYTAQRLLWLWIDLSSTRPALLPWVDLPISIRHQKSPLNLFLRAHFADRVLREVERDSSAGRVVHLRFGSGQTEDPTMEIRLFPHRRNLIARAAGKVINWQKPEDLTDNFAAEDASPEAVRSLNELREQWLSLRQSGKSKSKASPSPQTRLQQDLEKKKKAIGKVEDELARKSELPWRQIGDWLKQNQSLEVPRHWEPFVDRRRKLSWNIEQCYGKARETEAKIFGTEKRLAALREELKRLLAQLADPKALKDQESLKPKHQPLKDVEAHGRTLRLSQELTVVAGKNAIENMKILRRARAWDYWFHLRDLPGSHAILFRNKTTRVSDADFHRVAEWLVRQQFGAKYTQHSGEKVVLIVAECRHVSPIQGDRLGRVTFRNERTLIHRVP